jgi:predicted permease
VEINYWFLLSAVAPVFGVLLVGLVLRRIGLLSVEADASLLRITVNVLFPCLAFHSIVGNPALARPSNLIVPPVIGFLTVIVGYALGGAGSRLLRLRPKEKARTFAFTVGLYNYAYLAIPLVQAFFTRETLGVLFTFNLGVELAFWTGANLIVARISPRKDWHKVLSPPVVAILGSILLNLAGAGRWTPGFLYKTSDWLGQCAVPLALMVTGAIFADLLRANPPGHRLGVALGGVFLRIGLLPLFFLLAAKLLPGNLELKRVLAVQAAMPAAMLPVAIARHYGGDPGVAMQIVLWTTLLGLVTIPFWLQFGLRLVEG